MQKIRGPAPERKSEYRERNSQNSNKKLEFWPLKYTWFIDVLFLIKYGNYRSIPTATPLRCKYVPIITGATVFLWNRPVIQIVKAL